MNLINNVSKVITNYQSVNCLSKVGILKSTLFGGTVFTVQKLTQRKRLRQKKKNNANFFQRKHDKLVWQAKNNIADLI